MSYIPVISKNICENHGIDYYKFLNKESKINLENKFQSFKDVSIPIEKNLNRSWRIFRMHWISAEPLEQKTALPLREVVVVVYLEKLISTPGETVVSVRSSKGSCWLHLLRSQSRRPHARL